MTQLRAIYSGPGAEPRAAPAAAARQQRVRVDPDRRLDAADPERPHRRRCSRPIVTALLALGVAVFGAMAARAGAAAADSRDPERPDAPRPRRVRRAARSRVRTTSSASSAPSSTPSARSCRPTGRRWRGRSRTSSRPFEHLEDAVAIVSPQGRGAVRQPGDAARRCRAPRPAQSLDALRARRSPAAAAGRADAGQPAVARSDLRRSFAVGGGEQGERLILTHPVNDASGALVGIMLIVRNLEYLSQVQSTLRYSRKLAALGRLSAGVAHEVKNPLNAMMIHLELLRQQFAAAPVAVAARAARDGAVGRGGGPPPPTLDTADALSARRRHRRRDPAARRGRPGVHQVHAARGSQAAVGPAERAGRGSRADRAAGSRSRTACR